MRHRPRVERRHGGDGRAREEAGPVDVGDQDLMRSSAAAGPYMRPRGSQSKSAGVGDAGHITYSANSFALALPAPLPADAALRIGTSMLSAPPSRLPRQNRRARGRGPPRSPLASCPCPTAPGSGRTAALVLWPRCRARWVIRRLVDQNLCRRRPRSRGRSLLSADQGWTGHD